MKSYVSRNDRENCELFYDQEQWDSLREELQSTANRAAIEEVTGVRDAQLLEALAALNVDLETLAMITLVPMIQVAWASGQIEFKERETLLRILHGGSEVEASSIVHALLDQWLKREPTEAFYRAWSRCATEVADCLSNDMHAAFAEHILALAESVAKAAGGWFGFGRVCMSEMDAIDRIRETLQGHIADAQAEPDAEVDAEADT